MEQFFDDYLKGTAMLFGMDREYPAAAKGINKA